MTAEARLDGKPANAFPVRAEFSLARLRIPQTTWDGEVLPVGAAGTIVEILGSGREYVLDFVEPYDAVATVSAEHLEDCEDA